MKRKFFNGGSEKEKKQDVDIDEDQLVLLKAVYLSHLEEGEPVRKFVDDNGIR